MSSPSKPSNTVTALVFGTLPFLYAAATWAAVSIDAAAGNSLASRTFLLHYLIGSTIALWPFYLWLKTRKAPPLSAKLGAIIVFCATLVTPSLLQTDQLRYIWDGVTLANGKNPFGQSPAEGLRAEHLTGEQGVIRSPTGLPIPDDWTQSINHPQLPTLYPPLAQGAFALSAWLNPFFTIGSINHLFPHWMALFPTLNWWPWELGWRLIIATSLGAVIILLRKWRWDLVAFHPLVFLTAQSNIHIDVLLLPLLILCLMERSATSGAPNEPKTRWDFVFPQGFLFGIATLSRWTPVILLPAFLSFWARKRCLQYALLGLAGAVSTAAVGLALFLPGSNGNLFRSAGHYAQHWYFFGFAHRILADILAAPQVASIFLTLFGTTVERADGVQLAKLILFSGWFVFVGWLSWYAYIRKWSIWLSSAVTLTSFLVVTPTLHPWYFLPLIVLGVRHEKSLVTPWLWPMLAPMSYFFYFENSDPTVVRLLVYGVVTTALCHDGWRLWKSQTKKSIPLLKRLEPTII